MSKGTSARFVTTNVRLPVDVWHALRELAQERAEKMGGRPNASAILMELVLEASSRHRPSRRAA